MELEMKKRTSAEKYSNHDDWGNSSDDWGGSSDDWGSNHDTSSKRNSGWKKSNDDWSSNDAWNTSDDWGNSNGTSSKRNSGWGMKKTTESSQDWSGFSHHSKHSGGFDDSELSFSSSDYGMRKRRRISMPSLPSAGAVLKIGLIGIVIAVVVGSVFLLFNNADAIVSGIWFLIEKIIYAVFIALLFWGILNAFLKKVLPVKMQGIMFVVIFIISLICQFVPNIGSTLAVLVSVIFSIVLLLYLMVK